MFGGVELKAKGKATYKSYLEITFKEAKFKTRKNQEKQLSVVPLRMGHEEVENKQRIVAFP